jgi:nitrogen fixation protein FixH
MSVTLNHSREHEHDPKRGRWIPWAFVGGMLIVVAVNAVLVFYALTTFEGVTVPRSYERGRNYNHVIEEAARQDALGWARQAKLQGGHLVVLVTDAQGAGVPGSFRARLERPLSRESVPVALGMTQPGRYMAELPAGIGAGQWELRALLTGPGGARLEIRERLLLP